MTKKFEMKIETLFSNWWGCFTLSQYSPSLTLFPFLCLCLTQTFDEKQDSFYTLFPNTHAHLPPEWNLEHQIFMNLHAKPLGGFHRNTNVKSFSCSVYHALDLTAIWSGLCRYGWEIRNERLESKKRITTIYYNKCILISSKRDPRNNKPTLLSQNIFIHSTLKKHFKLNKW